MKPQEHGVVCFHSFLSSWYAHVLTGLSHFNLVGDLASRLGSIGGLKNGEDWLKHQVKALLRCKLDFKLNLPN